MVLMWLTTLNIHTVLLSITFNQAECSTLTPDIWRWKGWRRAKDIRCFIALMLRSLYMFLFSHYGRTLGGFLCAFGNFTNPVVTFTGGSDTKRSTAVKDKLATCHSHHKGTDWQMYRKRVRWPNTHCHNARRALLKTSTVVKDSYLLLLICVCLMHVLMYYMQEILS